MKWEKNEQNVESLTRLIGEVCKYCEPSLTMAFLTPRAPYLALAQLQGKTPHLSTALQCLNPPPPVNLVTPPLRTSFPRDHPMSWYVGRRLLSRHQSLSAGHGQRRPGAWTLVKKWPMRWKKTTKGPQVQVVEVIRDLPRHHPCLLRKVLQDSSNKLHVEVNGKS